MVFEGTDIFPEGIFSDKYPNMFTILRQPHFLRNTGETLHDGKGHSITLGGSPNARRVAPGFLPGTRSIVSVMLAFLPSST